MDFEQINITDIVPAPYNPRTISSRDKEKLRNSLEEFGLVDPIVINLKNNQIIGGHQRYDAILDQYLLDGDFDKKLNLIRLGDIGWVFTETELTISDENAEKALNIALNKISGEWDFEKLEEVFNDLQVDDYDVDLTGFDNEELMDLNINFPDKLSETLTETETTEDEYIETDDITVTVKKGEIYQLGPHRLMCGDSTHDKDIQALMNNEKADMVFTDPPYLMGFTGNVHADGTKSFNAKHGAIQNDKMSREDGDQFILKIFKNIQHYNRGAYYVCFYRLGLDYIFRALDKLGNKYKALIIWNKGNHTLSNSDYMSKYEPIVYGWFQEHNFYGDRSNFDIWDIPRTSKNDLHPTMKPIQLCSKAINNSSQKDDIVLDLFGGSGSTLIACEQLNRRCYTMELDEKYASVIIDRWEQFTGEKATLIEGGLKEDD